MELFVRFLLPIGLLFPCLSLLTLVASILTARPGHHASAILIPFFGPIVLTGWVLLSGFSPLWIPLVWVLDPGTVLFLPFLPIAVREWWETSRWTEVLRLEGSDPAGDRTAKLTLHRNGRYSLEVAQPLREDEEGEFTGGKSGGESGTYQPTPDGYVLLSHTHRTRKVRRSGEGTLISGDSPEPDEEGDDFFCLEAWNWRMPT